MLKLCLVELLYCIYIVYKLSWLYSLLVSDLLVPPLRHTRYANYTSSTAHFERIKASFPLTQIFLNTEKMYLLGSILVGTPSTVRSRSILFHLFPLTQL